MTDTASASSSASPGRVCHWCHNRVQAAVDEFGFMLCRSCGEYSPVRPSAWVATIREQLRQRRVPE